MFGLYHAGSELFSPTDRSSTFHYQEDSFRPLTLQSQREPANKTNSSIAPSTYLISTSNTWLEIFLNLTDSTKPDIIIDLGRGWTAYTPAVKSSPTTTIFRRDRPRRIGGGAFIAVTDKLTCLEVPELGGNNCEMVWVKIKLQGRRHLLAAAYYNPHTSDEESQRLFAASDRKATTATNSHLIIGGDLASQPSTGKQPGSKTLTATLCSTVNSWIPFKSWASSKWSQSLQERTIR